MTNLSDAIHGLLPFLWFLTKENSVLHSPSSVINERVHLNELTVVGVGDLYFCPYVGQFTCADLQTVFIGHFVSFIDQLLICWQRLHVIIWTARLLLTVILLTVIPIQQSSSADSCT